MKKTIFMKVMLYSCFSFIYICIYIYIYIFSLISSLFSLLSSLVSRLSSLTQPGISYLVRVNPPLRYIYIYIPRLPGPGPSYKSAPPWRTRPPSTPRPRHLAHPDGAQAPCPWTVWFSYDGPLARDINGVEKCRKACNYDPARRPGERSRQHEKQILIFQVARMQI